VCHQTECAYSDVDRVKVSCGRSLGSRITNRLVIYQDRDGVKINGVHLARVSPSEIEKVIREHPEVVDCVVAGVRGARLSDGLVPRAWLVLSDSAKAKGVARMLGAIEEFLRGRLSDQHWLHGGFEVIDEVAIRTLITGGK
jgi:acyl-CoA synthetase (AMP-forming)/AMP-acid ligase II